MIISRIPVVLPVKYIIAVVLVLCFTNSVADEQVALEITWTPQTGVRSFGGEHHSPGGLPENIRVTHITTSSSKILYLATYAHGLFKKEPSGKRWENISSADWNIRSIYNKNAGFRKISTFTVSNTDPAILACATKHTLYRSYDGGRSWKKVSTRGLPSNVYITSLAFSGKTLVVGTSFKGVYVQSGNTFISRSRGLPFEPYSHSLSFFEEIGTLYTRGNELFAGTFFTGHLYVSKNGGRTWSQVNVPWKHTAYNGIYDMEASADGILIAARKGLYFYNRARNTWTRLHVPGNTRYADTTPFGQYARHAPSTLRVFFSNTINSIRDTEDKFNQTRALYAGPPTSQKKMSRIVHTLKKTNLNAVVIDIKDDVGNIYAPVKNSAVTDTKARRKGLSIVKLNDYFHKNGIYTIARMVVFKDRNLYRAYNNKYSIWNSKTGTAWKGIKGEYWVDPYSSFVQKYNIDIAQQVSQMGFDEIQFDYIRFPVDGPTHLCTYRFRPDAAMYKSEILMDYLQKAKSVINTPISVDVYGFNGWYHFGNWIGQDVEGFSYIVDIICPMVYPSHFGNRFLMKGARSERPYRIVHASGMRSSMLSGKAHIRPYLQAFRMMSPTWGAEYITSQIQAAKDSKCEGYTFWHAAGEYSIIEKALKP